MLVGVSSPRTLADVPGLDLASSEAPMTLADAARLAGRLAAGTRTRAEILKEARLDELGFARVEASWIGRAGAAAIAGDRSLLDQWRDAHDAGLTEEVAAAPLPDAATWAKVLAARDRGASPPEVARAHHLSLAVLARAEAHWALALAADPALAAEVAALRAAAR